MDDFSTFCLPNPNLEEVTAEYATLQQELELALANPDVSDETLRAVVSKWDGVRRRIESWSNLVEIRFNQETNDPDYKAAQDYRDEISPKLTELNVGIQKMLVETPLRPRLEAIFGAHAFKLWEVQNSTFDPCIHDDLVQESKLVSRYNELTAAAKIEFQGEEFNLSSISKFEEHADRDVRYGASRAMWQWYAANRAELDQIYGELVSIRHGIAQKLGYDSFIELAYRRMSRTDYDADDVARYREEVREHVVPLCREIHRTQEETLNLEDLMFWDEGLFDSAGNPAPLGTHEAQIEMAQRMFNDMNVELGQFFQLMCEKNLLDLKIRPWKAGGGFCSSLPNEELPFIFANFNGSKGDVEVFTHEMGHAFQCYSSFDGAALLEHVWPTYEACEIHSMSLEFLTWPHMEMFFGDAAERFRRIHLLTSILFLPYGVAVDHYQHAIFAEPDATPERRHAIWQEMERLYLPDTNYGDLPHVSTGGRWQQKRHIYMSPFYYIDYTLAQCCALQFWVRSEREFATAMQDYVDLCKRGGTMPFSGLVDSAGLKNPFKPGSLKDVVQQAREYLKL
ncbi:M3 family oligoendopeptidase [Blastopirellula marina]|uniref:Peptidase M3 n=1 Tax=Blastopirellula marina TaxID=124 RepID=A0A2S8G6T5_9BACT|nr:M3 family oligoendopeptidase [Blastopirellula marina]PQO40162.1 peptidase M3 [Blastopirellula marina]PTL45529.1 M3 family oligoendopeptidase [Blastopirellula marina]